MRYAIAAALLLAALLSLNQISALQLAGVTGDQSILVTTTDSALLGLEPGTAGANAAGTAYYAAGGTGQDSLLLDFRKGYGSTPRGYVQRTAGVPRNDLYRYKGLFTVTNRSQERQCLRVYVANAVTSPVDLAGIYIRPSGSPYSDTGTQVAGLYGASVGSPPVSGCYVTNPGEVVDVDFWFAITSTGAVSPAFNVRVEGVRAP